MASFSHTLLYVGPSWCHLGLSWGSLEAILASPGAVLRPSWAILGLAWAFLGLPKGHLWAVLAHLGANSGPLAPPRAILAHILPIWGQGGPSCGLSWGLRGAFLVHVGPILKPSWGHLGVILGPSWRHPLLLGSKSRALLRFLNLTFYLSSSCPPTFKKQLDSRSQALEGPRRGREALTITIRLLC